jgi:hypothetical protein
MKTIFLKNGLTKKGVENFYLSNGTNKSISNFRETIPLNVDQICKLLRLSLLFSSKHVLYICKLACAGFVGSKKEEGISSFLFSNRWHLLPHFLSNEPGTA